MLTNWQKGEEGVQQEDLAVDAHQAEQRLPKGHPKKIVAEEMLLEKLKKIHLEAAEVVEEAASEDQRFDPSP